MTDEEKKAKAISDALEAEERKRSGAATAAADAAGEKLDKLLCAVDSLSKRMDALEENGREPAATPEPAFGDSNKVDEELEAADAAAEDSDQRADSAWLKTRPVKERHRHRMAAANVRADEVYSAFGKRAPAYLHGETLFAYRRRLLQPLQEHSADFKDVDLTAVRDARAFAGIERKVYADAMAKSANLGNLPNGRLRPVPRVDQETGQRIVEFHGDHSFIKELARQPRYVRRILAPNAMAH